MLPRERHVKSITDRWNVLATIVKSRSRASLTDANHLLETIARRFFNALHGWDLVNLNVLQANYPAADLGDRDRRIAIQVTNADGSDKIKHTAEKAVVHELGKEFDRLVVFFLLPEKPGFPRSFVQPTDGPAIETWDIADLSKQLQDLDDLDALERAAGVLEEEVGSAGKAETQPRYDISRIIGFAPAELIGREAETGVLDDAWRKVVDGDPKRPRVLTFVALGGEGKTSLVAKWAAGLAAQDWPGCDAAFAWSFYSQGTREQQAASSDLFLKEALAFLGEDADKTFAASPAGAYEKGQRLARLVGQRRCLLILDGLEPLQYAPTSPTRGELKDQGIRALLRLLASSSQGLCIVTTRISLPDLRAFWQSTAPIVELPCLSRDAGVSLLKWLGVNGSERRNIPVDDDAANSEKVNEYEKLVEDVKGHALTLQILGGFLRRAFGGDIRRRDRVKFEKADEKIDGGHAFRAMAAYERWLLNDGGEEGRREVAVLRFMGLFDRPADAGCLAVLRRETIPGLTEPLAGLADDDWEYCLSGLETAKLLTVNRDAAGALVSLDAHPHLREYFARQVRTQQPDAWRAAHRRLYEHLCATTKEGDQPRLEDLQPLYQAVAHGCQAGLQHEALEEVLKTRIWRQTKGKGHYSVTKLGAFGADLGALASFFDKPWQQVNSSLSGEIQGSIIGVTAAFLKASGRLAECLEPMREALEIAKEQERWKSAAIHVSNLGELQLTLGEVAGAVGEAEQSVTYADRGGDAFQRMSMRTTHADVLHQAGRRADAETRFREAEQMQQKRQPAYPLLYSLPGFWYCDLLLAVSEHAAWPRTSGRADGPLPAADPPTAQGREPEIAPHLESCRAVSQRAAQTLEWAEQAREASLLDIALDHLTLGRAALYEAILECRGRRRESAQTSHAPEFKQRGLRSAATELDAAVSGLRRAGDATRVPHALLSRAWLRLLTGARTGQDSAQADLDEAWEIAERGPMRLHMADIHLHRARLFGVRRSGDPHPACDYPWESPQADLRAARVLIERCGYWRRKEELEDAEQALGMRE